MFVAVGDNEEKITSEGCPNGSNEYCEGE